MNSMEQKGKLAKAIISVMKDVQGIEKNSNVGTGRSSYKGVNDKDVKTVIRKSMIENGLAIVPTSVSATTEVSRWEEDDTYNKQPPYPKKTKQSVFTEVKTTYLLMHEDGEQVELAGYGHGVDAQDKGAGKATTYALKYALLYTFLVPTGDIDDADSTHSNEHDTPKSVKTATTNNDNELGL